MSVDELVDLNTPLVLTIGSDLLRKLLTLIEVMMVIYIYGDNKIFIVIG